MQPLIEISESLRIFKRRAGGGDWKRYPGDAREICGKIVEDCWNGRFFQTSTGHFCQFYSRDFAWCAESLIRLGHGQRVRKTLAYALERFSKHGHIRGAITPSGKPFDFPRYAIDSVPYMIHTLVILSDHSLLRQYKTILEKEIAYFFKRCIDPETGFVKNDEYFTGMRDHAYRKQVCYDIVMVGMLAHDARKLGLKHPFGQRDYVKLIKHLFWNGKWFYGDLETKAWSSEANLLPFWSGLFNDAEMFRSVVKEIKKRGLDKPFPLKYDTEPLQNRHFLASLFAPNYEGDTTWMHLGMIYLSLLAHYDTKEFKKHIALCTSLIERHGTFLEVFQPGGEPYSTWFYKADEGMLWSAILLELMMHR